MAADNYSMLCEKCYIVSVYVAKIHCSCELLLHSMWHLIFLLGYEKDAINVSGFHLVMQSNRRTFMELLCSSCGKLHIFHGNDRCVACRASSSMMLYVVWVKTKDA